MHPASSGVSERRAISSFARWSVCWWISAAVALGATLRSGPEQLVDGRLGARRLVHALHDDRARERVLPVRRRQAARDDDGPRRHAPVDDLARGAIVDLRALPDEHA